jgi:hypothetical protein
MPAAELIMGAAADRRSVQNEKAMSNDSGTSFPRCRPPQLAIQHGSSQQFFSSLTSEELELEVAPARNRLVYIWGHLTAVNDAFFRSSGLANGDIRNWITPSSHRLTMPFCRFPAAQS